MGSGIHERDQLVVDRAVQAAYINIVMALIEGEFIVRRLHYTPSGIILRATSEGHQDILIGADQELTIWCVVRWVIYKV